MNSRASAATSADYEDGPRLLADVGGTNARFALERAPGLIGRVRTLHCADYPEFADAVGAYLAGLQNPAVRHAAIAIAGPVRGDRIEMTNHPWSFSVESSRRGLGFDSLIAINDFSALARSLPHLQPGDEYRQIGGGAAQAGRVIGVVGPGTGLGVAGLLPRGGRWIALDSEGGHVSFSPADRRESALLDYCWNEFEHVSAERLVSGPGLELAYRALGARNAADRNEQQLDAAQIVRRALENSDPLCAETVECFCAMLGTVASNAALMLGALGGIYIGGGIVPRLGDYFERSPFRRRFEQKGRYRDYLSRIPTFVITARYPALIGAAAILREHLGGADQPSYRTTLDD